MSLPGLAPVVAVLVLLELAAGTMVVIFVTDLLREVGRGFLGTTALVAAAVLGCALGIEAVLPDPSLLLHRAVSAGAVTAMHRWSVALLAALLLYAVMSAVGTDVARRVTGGVATACGMAVVVRAAEAFGDPAGGTPVALVTFIPAMLLCGTALAGMLLGHWYLIAPDLTFRPLRRAIYSVFLAVALQAGTLVVAVGIASSQARTDLVGMRYGLSFWLLVVGSGLAFTAAVNGLTLYFAHIRANQPATAMLYVLIISVLMGVVPAHLLYFLSGVPV